MKKKFRYFVGYIRHAYSGIPDVFGSCHIVVDEEIEFVGRQVEIAVQKELNTGYRFTILSCCKLCEVNE